MGPALSTKRANLCSQPLPREMGCCTVPLRLLPETVCLSLWTGTSEDDAAQALAEGGPSVGDGSVRPSPVVGSARPSPRPSLAEDDALLRRTTRTRSMRAPSFAATVN